jgi:hypothetical protein
MPYLYCYTFLAYFIVTNIETSGIVIMTLVLDYYSKCGIEVNIGMKEKLFK